MLTLAIFGCGDFLRWQADGLKASKQVKVVACFDPDQARAQKWAAEFGAKAVSNPEAVFADASIKAVALFVPPWIRKDLFARAAQTGKHVIATKPLGSTSADCADMIALAKAGKICAGIIYSRSGDNFMSCAKEVLDSGRYGRLALYKQDWIHAYPQWNSWATDPVKNGGPFMDAMIHNLNAACYLMGRPHTDTTFFSDRLAHPDLACADTEAMVVRYAGGGVANLFITWAADLATHSTNGNDREHIDLFYLVTNKGWRLTKEWREGGAHLVASREGKQEALLCPPLRSTLYDDFAAHVAGGAFPGMLATLEEAARDIALVRRS